MKTQRFFTTLLFTIVIYFGYGQNNNETIIYNNHYFKPGISVTYQNVSDTIIKFNSIGKAVTWNFKELMLKDDAYLRKIVKPEDTPFGSVFPEANVVIYTPNNKDYVYLKTNSYTTDFIGFVPQDTSYIVNNYKPWATGVHPMKYGDTLINSALREITLKDGRKIYRKGNVKTFVVGEGTLILPNQTYKNVLKIEETQIFYNPTETNFYRAVTYHWISNHTNFPLFSTYHIYQRSSKGAEQNSRGALFLVEEEHTARNETIEHIIKKKL